MREHIVQEAFSWKDTPWHHRACLKGIGTDCVMLLAGIAKAVGLLPATWQPPVYSPEWHLHQNEEMLLQVLEALGCRPVPLDTRQPGDALAFQFGRVSAHMGVLVARDPDYIIHAARDAGRVIHQGLGGMLRVRVRGCYAFPGVEVAP